MNVSSATFVGIPLGQWVWYGIERSHDALSYAAGGTVAVLCIITMTMVGNRWGWWS